MLGWETLLDEHFRTGSLQPVTSRRLVRERPEWPWPGSRPNPKRVLSKRGACQGL